MHREADPVTLADVVRYAVDACELAGDDGALDELLERFEDADEPVSAVPELDERIAEAFGRLDPEREDPAVAMAEAVVLYLARRRDEIGAPPADVLRLAARAEFHGHPPAHVAAWLRELGVQV